MSAVERWRMLSGRAASIDMAGHPDAVQGARELLRMNGAVRVDENAPDAVAAARGENQNTNTHEGEPIAMQSTDIAATHEEYERRAPQSRCAYPWCVEDHALSREPHLHIKHFEPFERPGIGIFFVLDEDPDAQMRLYLNWTDHINLDLTSGDLGELNDIAAALNAARAAFEQFIEAISA